MTRKYKKSKYSMGSVSWSRELLSDTDHEDTISLPQECVTTTSRHVTLDGDASASRTGKRTRFTKEVEVMMSTLEPDDAVSSEDISVPLEFETWLANAPHYAAQNGALEGQDNEQNPLADMDDGCGPQDDDYVDPSTIHDIADYVASVEANTNKSQRVRTLFVDLERYTYCSFTSDENITGMGRVS